MRTGKISENILKRSVLKKCQTVSPEILQGAAAGHDSALISMEYAALSACSTQTVVLDHSKKIRYGLEHAVNNLACSGCLPQAVLLSLLLPQDSEETYLAGIMEEAAKVCASMNVAIAGGHTEVSAGVNAPVLTVTAIGKVLKKEDALPAAGLGSGAEILAAGWIALEGTQILLCRHREELEKRFPLAFLEEARSLGESISVLEMAQEARDAGAVFLHDLSQGGVFGGLWELCEAGGVGMEAHLRRIPIRQETVEICEYFGINPYCLLSGGALLIAAKDGDKVIEALQKKGIPCVSIGRTTDGKDRVLYNGEEKRFLDKPAQDEIFRYREQPE